MDQISDLAAVEAALLRGSRLMDLDTGKDITRSVTSSFHRLLPECNGDRHAAAAQALNAVLAGAKREGHNV